MHKKVIKFVKLPFFVKLEIIAYYWYLLKTTTFYRLFFKKLGNYSVIYKPIKLSPNCISIGNKVLIYKHARVEAVHKYNDKVFYPNIIIEDKVTIQQNLHLTCCSTIKIGANTAIAANVTITDINHNYANINCPIEDSDIDANQTIIGRDCKIYNNVVILPGTIIGKHCIIGANSVVKGIIPSYSVAVGAPAKVIKQYDLSTGKWHKYSRANE